MTTGLTARSATVDPLALIDQACLAESTRARYRKVLGDYLAAGNSLTDSEALAEYAQTLSRSGRAFLKAALKLWTSRMEVLFKGQATPENVAAVQAALYRLDALNEAVTVRKSTGTKAHTWLNQKQVKALLDACGDDLVGRRDRLSLGLLVAAGLRREEAVELRFEDVRLQPVGERIRTVLAVRGKGAKDRVVPISDRLANAIDEWGKAVGHEGYVLRSLGMDKEIGGSLSAVALFNVVRKYGEMIGKPELAAHDLRRTYAQLGYEAGVPITQISKLLGHASVATTQRYLNLELDLESTISDFIPFE